VAIEDIVAKIRADAEAEAAAILATAQDDAERVVAEATARADADAKRALARERVRADADAETLLANARLAARDAGLTARLALANEALDGAEAALLALPDAEYAALIARAVVGSATGRESVAVAPADAARLEATLPAALKAAGVDVRMSAEPADAAHGVVLAGGGVRFEVSPAALVAAVREELLAEADRALFPREA
jgi:vacuolar-type H+-ATPase subunit E/Vma4